MGPEGKEPGCYQPRNAHAIIQGKIGTLKKRSEL